MESPLNNAHFYARKAENCMKITGYEKECLNYIEKCIESLDLSLTVTNNTKAIESIKLQRDHHMRQRELFQCHIDKFRRTSEKQKSDNSTQSEKIFNNFKSQNDLFENVKATEEMLEELKKSNPESSASVCKLLELNSNLHQILSQLVTQIDETVIENNSLKGKLQDFDIQANTSEKIVQIDDENLSDNTEVQEFAPLDLPSFDDL